MKTISYLFCLSLACLSGNASTVSFASGATSADASRNNSNGDNVLIRKNSAWADAIPGSNWISYSNTGDPNSPGFNSPANGTIVSFFQYFMLTPADLSADGTVSFLADDSASVTLNRDTLIQEGSQSQNGYRACSDFQPNCISVTTIALPAQDLKAGVNTIRFDVAQRAGSSFGLDYVGSAGSSMGKTTPTATPEPATWALLASGLLVFAVRFRKSLCATVR